MWDVIGCLLKVDSPEEGMMLLLPVQDRGCEASSCPPQDTSMEVAHCTGVVAHFLLFRDSLLMEMG